MISRYRIGGAIKTRLALLSAVVACLAGVWAPSASATTAAAATTASSCPAGTTGYWTGYWTWISQTQTWQWTWTWNSCAGGWQVG